MKTAIVGLFAETFIHPGAGQNTGVIDLPVAREAATDYPFIAGSSLKGALLDMARQQFSGEEKEKREKINKIFGEQDNAGQLLISDARLLLLPVRSLTGAYKWVTCRHLLERLDRDMQRGIGTKSLDLGSISVGRKEYMTVESNDDKIFLEERSFSRGKVLPKEWAARIKELIASEEVKRRIDSQLVVLNDDDFVWFARYGLSVQARNQLNKPTKTSGNLWYEETLPPDTLMYAVFSERFGNADEVKEINKMFVKRPYLQIGGNETVGQGWFTVKLNDHEAQQ